MSVYVQARTEISGKGVEAVEDFIGTFDSREYSWITQLWMWQEDTILYSLTSTSVDNELDST